MSLGCAESVCDSELRAEIAGRLAGELAAEVGHEYVWLNAGGCHRRVPGTELVEGAALRANAREVLVMRAVLGEM